MTFEAVPSSFRDPSGYVFVRDQTIFRQVNQIYREDYDQLMGSGLYKALVQEGILIEHEEVDPRTSLNPSHAYKLIKPQRVEFISYPYEWSFSQLKDAALVTLAIQKKAIDHGMTLKDATAFNIQFYRGKPILIDTLSFKRLNKNEPWVAYGQFCQHFLAPLALMAYRDARLGLLLRQFIHGIPLDLASPLLPWRTWFSPQLLIHLHIHSRMQNKYSQNKNSTGKTVKQGAKKQFSELALRGIVESLTNGILKLTYKPQGTEWGDYYEGTNYSDSSFQAKQEILNSYLKLVSPRTVWDLGANTGVFSRLASNLGANTVAFDIDPAAVEKNYRQMVQKAELRLLPLVLDLTNPTPDLGWDHRERDSLRSRGPADMVLALALIHHLCISNNLPIAKVAASFAKLGKYLVIEFVPKSDSQVQVLLATREDIFPTYTQAAFETEFQKYFSIERSDSIAGSERKLYLMRSQCQS